MVNLVSKSALGVLVISGCFAVLVLGVVLFGSMKGESAMENLLEKARVPPVDAFAPTETETATFALG